MLTTLISTSRNLNKNVSKHHPLPPIFNLMKYRKHIAAGFVLAILFSFYTATPTKPENTTITAKTQTTRQSAQHSRVPASNLPPIEMKTWN